MTASLHTRRHLNQRVDGYVATLVSGKIVMCEGQSPGGLMRGSQAEPILADADE